MRILVVGATGHNGAAVAERLSADGHHLSGLVRNADRAPDCLDVTHVGDVVTGVGLPEACAGIDVAYYFVHSLDSHGQDDLDAIAARNFAASARTAGIRRVVFFTTLPAPKGVKQPLYQRNRQVVEAILTEGIGELTVVRAGMVLGDRSRGMRPYVQLVQRAPFIPMGPWRKRMMAVVDSETVTACLALAGTSAQSLGAVVDVPASAELTHEDLVRAMMQTLRTHKPVVRLPWSSPTLDALLTSWFTEDSYHFSRHLASINSFDYTVDPLRAAPFAGIRPQNLDAALVEALQPLLATSPGKTD